MKTQHTVKLTSIFTLVLGLCFAGLTASAADGPRAAQAERMAVMFHADWCGSCKVLGANVKEAKSELKDDAKILFVILDLTDDATRAQSAMLAEALGLGSIYEAHGEKTGFMLVLDAKDKSILQKLTRNDEVDTIRSQLAGG